jgi:hypothetical protein
MDLQEFRALVKREFGERLERATPATVTDFMVKMQEAVFRGIGTKQPLELNETAASSWEQIVTDFFARVLDSQPEQLEEALMLLWLLGFQMHFARVEEDLARLFSPLLGGEQEELP